MLYYFAFVFLLAGMVKGMIGMGLPLVSITLMSMAIEPRVAIPFVLVSGIVLNLVQAFQLGSVRAVARRFTLLALATAIGVWAGTELLFALNQRIIEVVLGLIVCGYVIINKTRLPPSLSPTWEKRLNVPVGLIVGILQGATGSAAAPLAAWWQALGLKKDEFVQASGFVLFIVVVPWAASLLAKGVISWRVAAISAGLMLPAAAGMYLGSRVRDRVSEDRYRDIILGLLFVAGVVLLIKAFL